MNRNTSPRLRFAGFAGEWERKTLGEVTFKVKEKNTQLQYSETLTNSAEFGIISQRDFFDNDVSNAENIGSYYVVQPNDFVYNPRISSFASVGPIKRNKLGRTGVMSPLYYVFRLNNEAVLPSYLEHYFEGEQWHSFMFLNGDSGARSDRFSIKNDVFTEMPLALPTKPEQTALGDFFRRLDETLAQARARLAKTQQLKRAMLAKLFPAHGETAPKLRFQGFSGDWERKVLGEVSTIKTGSSNREDSDLSGEYTFFDRSQDVRRSNTYLFDCEAVIMAGEGSEFPPKYFVGKFDLHQRSYAIMNFKECDGLFVFYYLHLMNDYFYNQAVGSTVKSLRLPMFTEMPIILPSKEEQTAIGNFFQKLDQTLALQSAALEKLTRLKKALLAAMLV